MSHGLIPVLCVGSTIHAVDLEARLNRFGGLLATTQAKIAAWRSCTDLFKGGMVRTTWCLIRYLGCEE